MPFLVFLLQIFPKNLISYLVGAISRLALPSALQVPLNKAFVSLFRINMGEAEGKIEDFKSIEEVFTRKLLPDQRPIESELVSPADGVISASQPVTRDRLLQAKGLYYSAEELVFGFDPSHHTGFDPAWATTIYLAPHNYHRVHAPVSGKLREIIYHPGELWPVNEPFVRYVPRLFARNERLVFCFEVKPEIFVYAVMVGALNVGRIESPFIPGFSTNLGTSIFRGENATGGKATIPIGAEAFVNAGDEIGTFLLGSTVVMVFDRKFLQEYQPTTIGRGAGVGSPGTATPVRMGQSLLTPIGQETTKGSP